MKRQKLGNEEVKVIKNLPTLAYCATSMTHKTFTKIPSIAIPTIDSQKNPTTIPMPSIGFGTYKFKKGSGEAKQAVIKALQLGYTAIDTAFIYGGEHTEKEIGQALHEVSFMVPRSDVFLTSKQWRAYHGFEATLECLNKSLKRLQTDYLDLYLIHWPGPAYNAMNRRNDVMADATEGAFVYAKKGHDMDNIQDLRSETWRAMEEALYQGKCRAIGVSNFTVKHLKALKKTARVWPPAVNQIEMHPYFPQSELVEYCREEGIIIEAYASLGGQDSGKKTWIALGGKLLERAEVKAIAEKYNKTPAQVLLRWATQQGFAVIPKSSNVEHMKLNLDCICDWAASGDDNYDDDDDVGDKLQETGISEEDMNILNNLDQSAVKSREDGSIQVNEGARLCWVRDPLKMLDFE